MQISHKNAPFNLYQGKDYNFCFKIQGTVADQGFLGYNKKFGLSQLQIALNNAIQRSPEI